MPVRLCREPKCPHPATYRGRCSSHARKREAQTHGNKSLYNSKRWKMLRRQKLFNDPLCECADGCGGIATDVDHRVAYEDGGDFWAYENLQSLTHSCHSKKTARELRAR